MSPGILIRLSTEGRKLTVTLWNTDVLVLRAARNHPRDDVNARVVKIVIGYKITGIVGSSKTR
jgi:hypothetical protein